MEIKTEQTFRQFCKKAFSFDQFNNLHNLIGCTKYSITWAFNHPQKMSFQMLLALANQLNYDPLMLISTYECSLDKMTAREYLSLLD